MATPISPLYTVTEQYLDAVEKGQRIVLDLVEKTSAKLHELTPEQLTALVAKVAPTPADLDRGYALVNRAVKMQEGFTRELTKAFIATPKAATPAKPKRAA
ncbi:MAG TPA: hypothetical protein VFJ17_13495 [Mycobacteriales bacterium]|jgi:hypothetical protein|nr:hypothetical protein [Mycobacteriales bacterium]